MPRGIPRNKTVNQNIVHRMKIARGHLNKVIQMTEQEEYCIDIVHQSQAVQSALKKIDEILLKNHMETCVSESIKEGKSDEVIEEVLRVFEKR